MTLDPERVKEVFTTCLFADGEDHADRILAEGVVNTVGFHPRRIAEHKDEIEAMLKELPDEFWLSGGGGWTFLNACNDRHGNQWTGEHLRMEQLFQLGMAIGKVKSLMPRDMWSALPGGVPYYVIEA